MVIHLKRRAIWIHRRAYSVQDFYEAGGGLVNSEFVHQRASWRTKHAS